MSTAKKVIGKWGGPSELHRLTGIPMSTLYQRVNDEIKKTSVLEQLCWELLAVAPKGFVMAAAKRVAENNKPGSGREI